MSSVRKRGPTPYILQPHPPTITPANKIEQPNDSKGTTTADSSVMFLPNKIETPSIIAKRVFEQSPSWLLLKDTVVLCTMLDYLPNVVLPFRTVNQADEFCMNMNGAGRTVTQGLLFIIEILTLSLVVPMALFVPGMGLAFVLLPSWLAVYVLTWSYQAQSTCWAVMDTETKESAETHQDERWIFINGCATDYSGLKSNINLISKKFGREVLGIHNKTYGLVVDLTECLIQRCFAYRTKAVRLAYATIKPLVSDPDVKKIVLLGHSQGGIILSLVLDQLFAELSPDAMSKIEVYTFGSAASHFSNPLVSTPRSRVHFDGPSTLARDRQVITHIEHYANEYDMVPRWGVLNCAGNIQNALYSGSVFVRLNASGHFFNQHYLNPMFPKSVLVDKPSDGKTADVTTSNGETSDGKASDGETSDGKTSNDETWDGPFLNQSILLSAATVSETAAENTADNIAGLIGIIRKGSGLKLGSGQEIHCKPGGSVVSSGASTPGSGYSSKLDQADMVFSRTASGQLDATRADGRKVKDLSRLWRYLGGACPEDHVSEPLTPKLFIGDESLVAPLTPTTSYRDVRTKYVRQVPLSVMTESVVQGGDAQFEHIEHVTPPATTGSVAQDGDAQVENIDQASAPDTSGPATQGNVASVQHVSVPRTPSPLSQVDTQ